MILLVKDVRISSKDRFSELEKRIKIFLNSTPEIVNNGQIIDRVSEIYNSNFWNNHIF